MVAPRLSVEEALAKWDPDVPSGWERPGSPPARDAAERERAEVLRLFPLDSWQSLPLERYALTGDHTTFCYLMEFGTPSLGGIGGGSARKHLIYKRSADGSWYFDRRFSSLEEAWESVRSGFTRLFELVNRGEFAGLDAEPLNWAPSLTGKAVFTYFPDAIVPIYSHAAQQHFWQLLDGQGEVAWGRDEVRWLEHTNPVGK